jgi:limonene-1,2-epoxide hydrolase
MTESAQVVRDLLSLLADGQSDAAVALLHEDVEWRNSGLPTVRGRSRVGGLLRDMEKRGVGFEVTMKHLAADGDVVLTDRTDVLRYGRFETSFWVCGTFRVSDGLIVLWDDHYSEVNLLAASLKGAALALLPGRK